MSRTEEKYISKRLAMERIREIWIKGRKDSSHLSLELDLNHIRKGSQLKVTRK
jgi:hypothetical protein